MTDFLIYVLISSLGIVMIHTAFSDGMVLDFAGWALKRYCPEWLCKPLFSCMICMASVWGSVMYLMSFEEIHIKAWILFVFAVGGINTVLSAIINRSIIPPPTLDVKTDRDIQKIISSSDMAKLTRREMIRRRKVIEKLYSLYNGLN